MKTLYPAIEPFHHFFLETESVHRVYVEQCGNPEGFPVIFLHGGPCSGCHPDHRRFFNPERYHIILLDQRGCGRSLPFGRLQENSVQYLLTDLEKIRKKLAIDKWLLFGGSWGATLALLFAQKYSQRVAGMILRGVFLARQKDMDWFVRDGAVRIYPERWQNLIDSIPQNDNDLLAGLYDTVFGMDEVARRRVTKAWIAWGGQTALGNEYRADNELLHIDKTMVQQVQMEIHFAKNRYFVVENQILDSCDVLQDIPAIIIHGRHDMVCPVEAGYSLSRALPASQFQVLDTAGHVAKGEEMIDALVTATDRMLNSLL